ncbi:MAG: beta-3-deoxy-D-manno-oct-2-ulosonic acid transferase [Pseudomonadota bacterium]
MNNWYNRARALGINPHAPIYAIGFRSHWRKYVKRFFHGSELIFVSHGCRVAPGHVALIWGNRPAPGLPANARLLRLEDGFLRSVGLGSQFAQPLSWVVDGQGLYFDATGPSDLETMLNERVFTARECQRAQRLVEQINTTRISKYNTPGQPWKRPTGPQQVFLIVGQVETDASIAFGSTGVATNLALVRAVRASHPTAWLVYKPHPDVVAGARAEGESESQIPQHCNEVVTNASLSDLLDACDEVHVNTSLTGFEALIRNKPVVCHGLPFYAGWGLTTDKSQCHRRQRTVSLPELVAATLIEYPLYISRTTGTHTTPENTLEELQQWREQSATWLERFQNQCGKLTRSLANVLIGKR